MGKLVGAEEGTIDDVLRLATEGTEEEAVTDRGNEEVTTGAKEDRSILVDGTIDTVFGTRDG